MEVRRKRSSKNSLVNIALHRDRYREGLVETYEKILLLMSAITEVDGGTCHPHNPANPEVIHKSSPITATALPAIRLVVRIPSFQSHSKTVLLFIHSAAQHVLSAI